MRGPSGPPNARKGPYALGEKRGLTSGWWRIRNLQSRQIGKGDVAGDAVAAVTMLPRRRRFIADSTQLARAA